jgi:hypothetical protein
MSGYKRWFAPLSTVYGATIPRRFTGSRQSRARLDEKRQEQTELQAWEGEGGNPDPRSASRQSSQFAEPGSSTVNPSFNARAIRGGSGNANPRQ